MSPDFKFILLIKCVFIMKFQDMNYNSGSGNIHKYIWMKNQLGK